MNAMKMAAIALIAATAGFGALTTVQAQPARSYGGSNGTIDLGRTIQVREVGSDGVYEGTWTQRGYSNVYDGVWIFVPTGRRVTDVITVHGVVDGKLVMTRPGGAYLAPVRGDGSFGRGKASWVVDPGYYLEIRRR